MTARSLAMGMPRSMHISVSILLHHSALPGYLTSLIAQCVWQNSSHFGIAKVAIFSRLRLSRVLLIFLQATSKHGGTFIVARYWPQGNIVGEKPY